MWFAFHFSSERKNLKKVNLQVYWLGVKESISLELFISIIFYSISILSN